MFYDFPSFSCLSINDEAAHGVSGQRVVDEDDMLKIDISLVHESGICVDMARTVYYGDSTDTKNLCTVGQLALMGIELNYRPGDQINVIGRICEEAGKTMNAHVLFQLCGHGIGYKLHEDPMVYHVYREEAEYQLADYEVICVEPMYSRVPTVVYEKGPVLMTSSGYSSTHHEDMFMMTPTGLKNLTKF